MNNKRYNTNERGIALLITLLTMTVLLGISASLMNVTLKQYQFASIGFASETAFQAANAGMECGLYQDYQDRDPSTPDSLESRFDVGQSSPSISCMGKPDAAAVGTSGDGTTWASHRYRFTWGDPAVCSEIEIFKYFDATSPVDMTNSLRRSGTCPPGVTCTVIQARGYSVACPATGENFPSRSIERELTQRY